MKTEYSHKVLIVDDEPPIIKAIRRILHPLGLGLYFAENGETALNKVRDVTPPFSIVIADQKMPGMPGTELLALVKRMSPDTVRYLMTGYSDMDTIVDAVNKGAIHRYIKKPWDLDRFVETVQQGLLRYESHLNLQNLILTAKKQNGKLYVLNRELMEKTRRDNQTLEELDREVSGMAGQLAPADTEPDFALHRIVESLVESISSLEERQANLDRLYTLALDQLVAAFEDQAMRNGFEMPDSIAGGRA